MAESHTCYSLARILLADPYRHPGPRNGGFPGEPAILLKPQHLTPIGATNNSAQPSSQPASQHTPKHSPRMAYNQSALWGISI